MDIESPNKTQSQRPYSQTPGVGSPPKGDLDESPRKEKEAPEVPEVQKPGDKAEFEKMRLARVLDGVKEMVDKFKKTLHAKKTNPKPMNEKEYREFQSIYGFTLSITGTIDDEFKSKQLSSKYRKIQRHLISKIKAAYDKSRTLLAISATQELADLEAATKAGVARIPKMQWKIAMLKKTLLTAGGQLAFDRDNEHVFSLDYMNVGSVLKGVLDQRVPFFEEVRKSTPFYTIEELKKKSEQNWYAIRQLKQIEKQLMEMHINAIFNKNPTLVQTLPMEHQIYTVENILRYQIALIEKRIAFGYSHVLADLVQMENELKFISFLRFLVNYINRKNEAGAGTMATFEPYIKNRIAIGILSRVEEQLTHTQINKESNPARLKFVEELYGHIQSDADSTAEAVEYMKSLIQYRKYHVGIYKEYRHAVKNKHHAEHIRNRIFIYELERRLHNWTSKNALDKIMALRSPIDLSLVVDPQISTTYTNDLVSLQGRLIKLNAFGKAKGKKEMSAEDKKTELQYIENFIEKILPFIKHDAREAPRLAFIRDLIQYTRNRKTAWDVNKAHIEAAMKHAREKQFRDAMDDVIQYVKIANEVVGPQNVATQEREIMALLSQENPAALNKLTNFYKQHNNQVEYNLQRIEYTIVIAKLEKLFPVGVVIDHYDTQKSSSAKGDKGKDKGDKKWIGKGVIENIGYNGIRVKYFQGPRSLGTETVSLAKWIKYPKMFKKSVIQNIQQRGKDVGVPKMQNVCKHEKCVEDVKQGVIVCTDCGFINTDEIANFGTDFDQDIVFTNDKCGLDTERGEHVLGVTVGGHNIDCISEKMTREELYIREVIQILFDATMGDQANLFLEMKAFLANNQQQGTVKHMQRILQNNRVNIDNANLFKAVILIRLLIFINNKLEADPDFISKIHPYLLSQCNSSRSLDVYFIICISNKLSEDLKVHPIKSNGVYIRADELLANMLELYKKYTGLQLFTSTKIADVLKQPRMALLAKSDKKDQKRIVWGEEIKYLAQLQKRKNQPHIYARGGIVGPRKKPTVVDIGYDIAKHARHKIQPRGFKVVKGQLREVYKDIDPAYERRLYESLLSTFLQLASLPSEDIYRATSSAKHDSNLKEKQVYTEQKKAAMDRLAQVTIVGERVINTLLSTKLRNKEQQENLDILLRDLLIGTKPGRNLLATDVLGNLAKEFSINLKQIHPLKHPPKSPKSPKTPKKVEHAPQMVTPPSAKSNRSADSAASVKSPGSVGSAGQGGY